MKSRLFLAGLFLLLFALMKQVNHSYAQTETNWSEPILLFEDGSGFSRRDFMLADFSDAVHLFWAHNPRSPYTDGANYDDSETAIFYQRLQGEDWLEARDILLPHQATFPFGAVGDAEDNLHVTTAVGGPPCVAYINLPLYQVADPLAWSQPGCLDAIGVGGPDMAIVPESGHLFILYPHRDQKEISLLVSTDNGRSWSFPQPVARIESVETNLGFPRLFADDQGRLHATWGELQAPGGYPWQRIMYARSTDDGQTWSEPFPLADANQGEQNLAIHGNTVHAVWNGDAGYQGRYYRVSQDGGLTWSERFTLPLPITSGGLQGAPAIVVDNTATVHILYTDSPRLYYITQRNDAWSAPLQIAGPENTGSTIEINFPMLSITEGNQLHALYTRDAQAVYYQQRIIEAAHQPSEISIDFSSPLPAPEVVPTMVPEQPAPTPVTLSTTQPPPPVSRGFSNLILNILPALLLVSGVALFYIRSRQR